MSNEEKLHKEKLTQAAWSQCCELVKIYGDVTMPHVLKAFKMGATWEKQQYASIIEKWKKEAEINHDVSMAYEQGKHDAMEQFKEYLEKKKAEYLLDREKYLKTKGLEQTAVVSQIRKDTIEQIINELFGGE